MHVLLVPVLAVAVVVVVVVERVPVLALPLPLAHQSLQTRLALQSRQSRRLGLGLLRFVR